MNKYDTYKLSSPYENEDKEIEIGKWEKGMIEAKRQIEHDNEEFKNENLKLKTDK